MLGAQRRLKHAARFVRLASCSSLPQAGGNPVDSSQGADDAARIVVFTLGLSPDLPAEISIISTEVHSNGQRKSGHR